MDTYEEYCPNEYHTLFSLLKLLRNIKPKKSKEILEQLYDEYLKCKDSNTKFEKYYGNQVITESDIKELWILVDNNWGNETIKISPKGASILRELYLLGELVLKEKTCIEYNGELDEYINLHEEFFKVYKRIERTNYLITHTAEISVDDFSYELLDQVFIERCGYFIGTKSLILDGIEVFKNICSFKSNSRKSTDYEVRFYWIDKEGHQHELLKESRYSNNRRNDALRNWGLGR